jgi:hypothetical protein
MAAQLVVAAVVECWESDWTADVTMTRFSKWNSMRRPIWMMCRSIAPPCCVEPTNNTAQNVVKRVPPRTSTFPRSPGRTISSYTLEPVLATIVSNAAQEARSIDAADGLAEDITRTSFIAATSHGNIYATPRGQYEGGFSLFEENGAIPPCA